MIYVIIIFLSFYRPVLHCFHFHVDSVIADSSVTSEQPSRISKTSMVMSHLRHKNFIKEFKGILIMENQNEEMRTQSTITSQSSEMAISEWIKMRFPVLLMIKIDSVQYTSIKTSYLFVLFTSLSIQKNLNFHEISNSKTIVFHHNI